MNFQIHCLMTNGGMLTDVMRSKLYQVARDMLLANKTHQSFRTKAMEGIIVTQNKRASMGFISGIECEADFETEQSERKMTVKFIMTKPYAPDEMIEQWKWQSLEEMLEEEEREAEAFQNHPASKAHLN